MTAVLAYLLGIAGIRRLGSGLASFVALTEVVFAVLFAVVLLGQRMAAGQLLGGRWCWSASPPSSAATAADYARFGLSKGPVAALDKLRARRSAGLAQSWSWPGS